MAVDARTRWREARRRQELSSDGRAARFARSKAWDQQVSYAKRLSYRLVVVALGFPAATVPLSLAIPEPWRWLVLGFAIASGLWFVAVFVLLNSGAASTLLGAGGEEMTVDELRILKRRGWRVVNGLLRGGQDIDHVAVGPGGVLVFETKRSSHVWPIGVHGEKFMEGALSRAVVQARNNARYLTKEFEEVLGEAPVRAVVVAWSTEPEVEDAPHCADYGRVTVVHGRRFGAWLQDFDAPAVLDDDDVDRVWGALAAQASIDDGVQPPPRPTFQQALNLMLQLCAGVIAASYALVGFGAIGLFRSWGVLPLAPVAGIVLGLRARRYGSLRWAATGWAATFAAFLLLVAAYGALSVMK